MIERYKEEMARLESKLQQAEVENLQSDSKNIPKSEKGTQVRYMFLIYNY